MTGFILNIEGKSNCINAGTAGEINIVGTQLKDNIPLHIFPGRETRKGIQRIIPNVGIIALHKIDRPGNVTLGIFE
jgi:hypothetical protein